MGDNHGRPLHGHEHHNQHGSAIDELAAAERQYHNREADAYVTAVERAHVFHLPDERLLFRYVPEVRAGHGRSRVILDVACGPSISIRKNLLRRLGPTDTYIGVDIADRLLAVARQNVPCGVFVQHDLQRLRLLPESVDVVIGLGALHHAPEPEAVLIELISSLRPGGLLLLREPTDRAFRRGQGESPVEAGINMEAFHTIFDEHGCRIIEEAYLTSWAFIKARGLLQRARLNRWERWEWPWYVKMQLELLADRVLGAHLHRRLKGLDVYLVAVREPAPDAPVPGDGQPTLADILACTACGRPLEPLSGENIRCSGYCGGEFALSDGFWTFRDAD